jgi:hypothetical protein
MADTLPPPRDPQGAAAARETFAAVLDSFPWLSLGEREVIERAAVELGMRFVEAYARSPQCQQEQRREAS